MLTARGIWQDLKDRRVELPFRVCLYCDGYDGVLRRHHCKHELELYCDRCERWTGHRIAYSQVLALVETGVRAGAQENPIFGRQREILMVLSSACPVDALLNK